MQTASGPTYTPGAFLPVHTKLFSLHAQVYVYYGKVHTKDTYIKSPDPPYPQIHFTDDAYI